MTCTTARRRPLPVSDVVRNTPTPQDDDVKPRYVREVEISDRLAIVILIVVMLVITVRC